MEVRSIKRYITKRRYHCARSEVLFELRSRGFYRSAGRQNHSDTGFVPVEERRAVKRYIANRTDHSSIRGCVARETDILYRYDHTAYDVAAACRIAREVVRSVKRYITRRNYH